MSRFLLLRSFIHRKGDNEMITYNRAKEIAYKAGAVHVDRVASFLIHCADDDDCRNSLRQLRSNDPELFLEDYRQGPKHAS